MLQPIEYGVYPWWPENGDAWIHSGDVALARRLIPGGRVFRREGRQGDYILLAYGQHRLRVRPALWLTVRHEGLEIGDQVEVLSRLGKNRPTVATIRDIYWDEHRHLLRYFLWDVNRRLPESYLACDLRRLEPLQPSTFNEAVLDAADLPAGESFTLAAEWRSF